MPAGADAPRERNEAMAEDRKSGHGGGKQAAPRGGLARRLALGVGLHHVSHLRYMLLDALFRPVRAEGQDQVLAALARHRGGTLAVTIAYNVPAAVALLAQGMARFLPGTPLLVADNSSEPAARAEIAAIAAAHGLIYISLPKAPLVRARTARSHAAAANWVFHNLIRPTAPKVFAMLDHDLVPLAPDDLAAHVARQPFYGYRRDATRAPAWYLWPGFSVFDFAVARRALDFGPDRLLGTDTGGRNWYSLYSRVNPSALEWPTVRTVRVPTPDGWTEPKMLINGWLHVGGVSYRGGVTALDVVAAAYGADPEGLLGRLVDADTVPAGAERPAAETPAGS